jgi:hypothetical protein
MGKTRKALCILGVLACLGITASGSVSAKPGGGGPTLPWTPLILHQEDPPDGVCGGSTTVLNLNYPAAMGGQAATFDAVITAHVTGGVSGSVAFGIWEDEVSVNLPANSPLTTYTLTLSYPGGIVNAPMYVETTVWTCPALSSSLDTKGGHAKVVEITELDIYIH